ncbi:SEC23-interacting protein-like isoform X3 [Oopsacas minuta]|uniref:SEC23-interacting protein-like isoform X3 n=1 Tax=Oopsacas minuta TaxID=111878 RepID=A0AAV7JZ36_9METZ|nr:SEC23-interacting protein-like isoform X3 [Oopsacas minuta]
MEPITTNNSVSSPGLLTSSLSRPRVQSNSDALAVANQRTSQPTANPLRSSKEKFIFNPITLQTQNNSKSKLEQESNALSRFTNLTKMLPKRPPSPNMNSQTHEPSSPSPPPLPVSNPPNMLSSSTKRSSLSGVMNFPALERLLASKKSDSNSKTSSTPPSPSLSPSNSNLHITQVSNDVAYEIHSEMEILLEMFNQERCSILQELSLVKGLWLTDRKKAKHDMEGYMKRISNTLKRYDSLVVEIMRQFNTVANEITQLKESQKKFQSDMRRRMESLQSDLAETRFNRDPLERREFAEQSLSPTRKESCESINIPPATAKHTRDKNIGRTTSVDSNIQKYGANKLSRLGKRISQTNLAQEDETKSNETASVKDNELRTGNKKKIEKFFGEVPPHTEDLSSFLRRFGYERYLSNFEKEEITLSALFHMSEEHLILLNIPMGPRLIMLREAYGLAKTLKHHNINNM